jgi:hypothetical protein
MGPVHDEQALGGGIVGGDLRAALRERACRMDPEGPQLDAGGNREAGGTP